MTNEEYCESMANMFQELSTLIRESIKVGAVVSVDNDRKDELFMVVATNNAIEGYSNIVCLMDRNYKKYLVNIENILIKPGYTIDDMFPVKKSRVNAYGH